MLIKNKTSIILLAAFSIYLIHISGYISAYLHRPVTDNYGGFFIATPKGDQGESDDQMILVTLCKAAFEKKSFPFVKDPYLPEYSNNSIPNGNLIYILASLPLYVKDNINLLYFINPLFSIALSVLLIYLIMRNKLSQNSDTLIFVFGLFLLLLTSYSTRLNTINLLRFVKYESFIPKNLGYIGRFPHIQFSIFLLIFWYYTFDRFLKDNSAKNAFLLGVSLSVLQYSYFYFWTAAIGFTAIMLMANLKKDKIAIILLVILVYIFFTLPFWVRFLTEFGTPHSDEYALRMGKIFSNELLIFKKTLLFPLIVLSINFYLLREKPVKKRIISAVNESSEFICLTLVTFLLANLQVVTGYNVQPGHWYQTFYYPVFCILITKWMMEHNSLFRIKTARILVSFFMIIIVGGALINNYFYGKRWARFMQLTKDEAELIDYINSNVPEKKLIATDNFNLNSIIRAYSNCYTLVPNGFSSNLSNRELMSRAIFTFRSMGYTEDEFIRELNKSEQWITGYQRQTANNILAEITSLPDIPDNYIALHYLFHRSCANKEYTKFALDKNLLNQIETSYDNDIINYQPDYLIHYKNYSVSNPILPEEVVFANNSFTVYKSIRNTIPLPASL